MDTRQLYRALFELMQATQSVLAILQEELLSEEVALRDLDQEPRAGIRDLKEDIRNDSSESEVQEVTISLLSRRGEVPATSRLNMGHSVHYDNHQASILIHSSDWSFFPEPQKPFIVTTDDNQRLTMKVAGDRSRTLVTDRSYRILSEYIRHRLGVTVDTLITREMLEDYGRTDITFSKRSGEYCLDFSVQKGV